MPRTPAQRSIRDARSLTQKLYSQCRDSSTGYKTLAQPLRKLRNVLEDFEELAADRQAHWVISPRFIQQLDACTSLLQELDLTLQSHRCSTHKWQDVHQQTIVRLVRNIAIRTEELIALHDTISRGPDEGAAPPATVPIANATVQTATAIDQPTILAECDGDTFMIVAVEENVKKKIEEKVEEIVEEKIDEQVEEKRTRRFSWEEDNGRDHEEVLTRVRLQASTLLPEGPTIEPVFEEIEEDLTTGDVSLDSIHEDDETSNKEYISKTLVQDIVQQAPETTAEALAGVKEETKDAAKLAIADHSDLQEELKPRRTEEEAQAPSAGAVEDMTTSHTHIAKSAESAVVAAEDEPDCSNSTSFVAGTTHHRQKSLTEDDWDTAFRGFADNAETCPTQASADIETAVGSQEVAGIVEQTQDVQLDDVDRASQISTQDTRPGSPSLQNDIHYTTLIRSSPQSDMREIIPLQSSSQIIIEDTIFQESSPQEGTSSDVVASSETIRVTSPSSQTLGCWLTPSIGSSIFQSPFATFDPLSMDIESASSFLLGGADAESSPSITSSRHASPQPTLAAVEQVEDRAEVQESTISQEPSSQNSAPTADSQQAEDQDETMDVQADEIADAQPEEVSGEVITAQVSDTMAAQIATQVSPTTATSQILAAGLGITFESTLSTSPTMIEADVADTCPTLEERPAKDAAQAHHGADDQAYAQVSHAPLPTILMELARNDSVHATRTTRSSSEGTNRPLSPIDQLLASFHEDENALAEHESSISSIKAKWLSLRPSSSPVRTSTHMPRSKFSLHQQLRRVSFRTKSAIGEPAMVDSKTSLNDSISEEGTNDITNEDANEDSGSHPSTVTSTNENTPLASPAFSATTSPLMTSDNDKVLPAIPPPPPIRAPPQIPDTEDELSMRPAPPMPPPKKYRIVNPSPPSVYSTVSEDLYSSSRPTSPTSFIPTEPMSTIQIAEEPVGAFDGPHTDKPPTMLHSALTHTGHAQRRSADQAIEQRYFRVELEEPVLDRGRRQSTSALPNGSLRSASISAPSSIHDDEQHHIASSTISPASTLYSVDSERLDRLCACWREQQWELAASYLRGHLDAVLDKGDTDAARRVMHLLGVCTSYTGQWQKALSFFIAAIHAPVKSIHNLDSGDLAAFYWLGDCYAMLNRRTEALVAYSVALQVHNRRAGALASQAAVLRREINTLLSGATPRELAASWEKMKRSTQQATDTILDRSVLEPVVVTLSLELAAQCRSANVFPRVLSRAGAISELEGATIGSSRLTPESFKRGNPWPEPYDAFFSTGNVAAGRLCDRPTSLLRVLVTQPIFKVPKSGPVGSTRLDCFTCNHLDWLIVAIRQCLTFLEMRWDEVANEGSSLFLCRFAVKSRNIVTAHYYSISIFKQAVRPGYGVEVCVDGVKSARILAVSPDYVDGVRTSCDKRLRKLVRDYLAHAYKLWLKEGKKPVSESMLLMTSASVREQAAGLLATSSLMSIAPALPLRNKVVYA